MFHTHLMRASCSSHTYLSRTPHTIEPPRFDELASVTSGFVGADLAALHRYSALASLTRAAQKFPAEPPAEPHAEPPSTRSKSATRDSDHPMSSSTPQAEVSSSPAPAAAPHRAGGAHTLGTPAQQVVWADVQAALPHVRPSALREVELKVPRVSWADIGGQEELKQALKEAVRLAPLLSPRTLPSRPPHHNHLAKYVTVSCNREVPSDMYMCMYMCLPMVQQVHWPLQHADAFARLGVRPPRGVLMYGHTTC